VVIGSRKQDKAERVASEVNELLGDDYVRGLPNDKAAAEATIAVLTVPYAAHKATLEGLREPLKGKIVVDVTIPLQPPNVTEVFLPEGRSAAEEAQAILGDDVRVVAAFQHISHTHLKNVTHEVDCDVLVCGDDEEAKEEVIALVTAAGMRGIDAGKLVNAVAIEAFTPVLLSINKRYKVKGAGLKITGLPTL
jgi:NADPH-dependent F420 reductase